MMRHFLIRLLGGIVPDAPKKPGVPPLHSKRPGGPPPAPTHRAFRKGWM